MGEVGSATRIDDPGESRSGRVPERVLIRKTGSGVYKATDGKSGRRMCETGGPVCYEDLHLRDKGSIKLSASESSALGSAAALCRREQSCQ